MVEDDLDNMDLMVLSQATADSPGKQEKPKASKPVKRKRKKKQSPPADTTSAESEATAKGVQQRPKPVIPDRAKAGEKAEWKTARST